MEPSILLSEILRGGRKLPDRGLQAAFAHLPNSFQLFGLLPELRISLKRFLLPGQGSQGFQEFLAGVVNFLKLVFLLPIFLLQDKN